jgi:hypothetical protein
MSLLDVIIKRTFFLALRNLSGSTGTSSIVRGDHTSLGRLGTRIKPSDSVIYGGDYGLHSFVFEMGIVCDRFSAAVAL